MSNVIEVEFGAERGWADFHEYYTEALLSVERECGGDEALLRLKVDRALALIRELREPFPSRTVHTLPADFTPEQIEAVQAALRAASEAVYVQTTLRRFRAVLEALPDLMTSRLARK